MVALRAMVALELASVSKRYGSRTALSNVSLTVASGSAVGLLGPNGAGKTTALRLLLGFTRPSGGGLLLHGHDPMASAAREGVGYLPERLILPGRMRVRHFLRLHGSLAGLVGANRDEEVDEVMDLMGIADRARDRLSGLSKGLLQRVGFAQAFLGKPRLLLLDEPTSGLDPIGVRDARDWIAGARERGCTVLVSSHILSEVERTCDQIAILHEGRVVASGRLDQVVRADESLEDAFLRLVSG